MLALAGTMPVAHITVIFHVITVIYKDQLCVA